jgi:hypothetical protein
MKKNNYSPSGGDPVNTKNKDSNIKKNITEEIVPDQTIEQERESARESFWHDDNINTKIVHESGDENELTAEDAREAAFEVIQTEDEIEKYKP